MAGRNARQRLGSRAHRVTPPGKISHRPVKVRNLSVVWIFLIPFNSASGSINPNSETIVVADSNLRTPVKPGGSALEVNHNRGIVIERPPFTKMIKAGTKCFYLQSGQVRNHMFKMRPNIANAIGNSSPGRVCPPGRLPLASFFYQSG